MVNTVDELKALIDGYSAMLEKAEKIADGYNFSADWMDYDPKTDSLIVHGTETCRGCTDHESYSFPMSWMFMSDDELKEAKAEKKRQEELRYKERKRQEAERKAREQEQRDKEEYERLKRKYGQ